MWVCAHGPSTRSAGPAHAPARPLRGRRRARRHHRHRGAPSEACPSTVTLTIPERPSGQVLRRVTLDGEPLVASSSTRLNVRDVAGIERVEHVPVTPSTSPLIAVFAT